MQYCYNVSQNILHELVLEIAHKFVCSCARSFSRSWLRRLNELRTLEQETKLL